MPESKKVRYISLVTNAHSKKPTQDHVKQFFFSVFTTTCMYLWCAKCRGIMYYCPCGVLSLNVQHLGTKNDTSPRHERDKIYTGFIPNVWNTEFTLRLYLRLFVILIWLSVWCYFSAFLGFDVAFFTFIQDISCC